MNIKKLNEELSKLLEFHRDSFNQEPGLYDKKFGYDKDITPNFSVEDKKIILNFEVRQIIKDNKLPYDIYSNDGEIIGVEVDGDWKHDHAFFDKLMNKYGFFKEDEEEQEADNLGDSYCSVHYFTK